jgi:hypothetical protein
MIEQVGRLIACRPSTEALERALAAFELEPAHVVGWSWSTPAADRVVVVTAGGRRLSWPEDGGRALTATDRDGKIRDPKFLKSSR